jgi:PKD repeat protein
MSKLTGRSSRNTDSPSWIVACGASLLLAAPLAAADPGAARFQTYLSPPTLGNNAGEPSIGVDWKPNDATLKHDKVNTGGVTFFQSGPNTLRTSFDDCSSPASDLWEDVSSSFVSQFVLSDPIGWVDHQTGRVFSLDLIGGEGQSFMAFSDDDGKTYTPTENGPPAGSPDHETLGGGPYAPPLPNPGLVYPNATYYCGQAIANNFCARSDDGGLTFGPQVPLVHPPDCEPAGAQNGHVKVGPDGTVYVPQGKCPNAVLLPSVAAVSVSRDNGVTWTLSQVPNSTSINLDPSVAIDGGNNVYLTWLDANQLPHVAVSKDHGATWAHDTDVGAALGIQNANFVISTAGDSGRAAVGFLGTTTAGNPNDMNHFRGIWHLYVATTYDGGATWTTVDATPDDPVQVGSVCTAGTTCGADRNLLDFNDMQVDSEGRIVVAFADGCVPPGCTTATAQGNPPYTASRSAKASIARQSGGKRMFAAFDPVEPALPGAPRLVAATADPTSFVTLTWLAPDSGGSPITGYKVYRGTASGAETPLATAGPGATSYVDAAAAAGTQYFYKVTAVNAQGESLSCREIASAVPAAASPCSGLGLLVANNPGHPPPNVPPDPSLAILHVFAGEPFLGNGVSALKWTLQVKPAGAGGPQKSGEWYILWNRQSPTAAGNDRNYVAMKTDAAGTLSFEYGTITSPQPIPPPPGDTTVHNVPQRIGAADASSSYDPALGLITIVIDPALFADGLGAGKTLLTVEARTFVGRADGAPINQSTAADFSADGQYTMVGNAACNPAPPVAALAALPTSGKAPLQVAFDASGSTSPAVITSYQLDFGDGSPEESQLGPSFQHTYTVPGIYPARLTVTDSRGRQSANSAQVIITVLPAIGFYTVAPCRVLDTRQGGQPLTSGSPLLVTLAGNCGIAGTAGVVSLNVTVTQASNGGFLTLYAGDTSEPNVSNLNFAPNQTRANNAIVMLAADGTGRIAADAHLGGGGTVHVIVDVNGYFVP